MGISTNFVKGQWFTPPAPLYSISVDNTGGGFGFGAQGGIVRMYGDSTTNTSWASWYPTTSDFCIESWIRIMQTSSSLSTFWTLGGGDPYLYNVDLGIGLSSESATYGTDNTKWVLLGALQGMTGAPVSYGNLINYQQDPLNASCFITPDTWTHIAMTRQGNNVKLWVNGVLSYSLSTSLSIVNPSSTGAMISMFGAQAFNQYTDGGVGVWNFSGQFRNVRYTVGNAVYTSAFTPPPLKQFLNPLAGTYFKMSPSPTAGDISIDISNNPGGQPWQNECPGNYNYQIYPGSGRQDGSGASYSPGYTLLT